MSDQASKEESEQDVRRLTAEIVAAFLAANTVQAAQLPELIRSVFTALKSMDNQPEEPAAELLKPAVPIRKSVTRDFIVCLEDGKKLKMLKRHLRTTYSMSPDDYRAKWGLPADYPMVAPAAERRSEFAKKIDWAGRPPSPGEESGARLSCRVERSLCTSIGRSRSAFAGRHPWRSSSRIGKFADRAVFGQYRGKAVIGDDAETSIRDLDVSIEPDGEYFKINWSTATRRGDGEIKHKSYSISFAPSGRPDIYRSLCARTCSGTACRWIRSAATRSYGAGSPKKR